jgi:predicted nuclease of predicted toxin-antitoxin system
MKLLFDQNLSPRLAVLLADIYPDSAHVIPLGLDEAEDLEIWSYAKDHDFVIVSKDSDFQTRSQLFGAPPKVVWIRLGNCSRNAVEKLLRDYSAMIHTFALDPTQAILLLPTNRLT